MSFCRKLLKKNLNIFKIVLSYVLYGREIMKKILSIIIIGLLLAGSSAVIGICQKSKGSTITVQYCSTTQKIQEITINNQSFVKIINSDSGSLHRPGEPILPRYVETYELPFGTTIKDISYEINGIHSELLSQKLLPSPQPVINGVVSSPSYELREDTYNANKYYPSNWYAITTGAGLNEENQQKTFVTIQVFPTRYNPVENLLLYAKEIQISVSYKEPEESLLAVTDEFDMVIIAPSCFSSDLQPLLDHKNAFGIRTFLKTTEEIYGEYNGVDKPEQIKYFIKDAKETWNVTYVLLVGGLKSIIYGVPKDDANQGSDDWYIPVRYTNLNEGGLFSDPGFISDLYYMDLYDGEGHFSSWDSNGDGIFAQWKFAGISKDIIDFYPDVYVGRLPCRNIIEVKTVVDKIITYENSPIDQSWFKRMVLVGGDGFDDSGYGTHWPEDELWCDKYCSYMPDVEPIPLYASNRENHSEYTPLTSNILRELNSGCGFIVFSGHGQPFRWITHWCDEFDTPIEGGGISTFDFSKVSNGDKLPICCIAGGCHNSLFNVSALTTLFDRDNSKHLMTYGKAIPECLGWTFVRKSGGGAIANFGYPSSTYFSPGETGDLDGNGVNEPDMFEAWRPYMIQQYYKLFGEDAEYLGDVAGGAVRNYLQVFPGMDSQLDAKIIEQVIFFGDPSLKIGGYG